MTGCPLSVLDANLLVPPSLRDLVLRIAEPPALYQPCWSQEILHELRRTLEGKIGLAPGKVDHLENQLAIHFAGSLRTGFEHLIPYMKNHVKDRHVLALAAHCRAEFLVTFNRRDFPASACDHWKVRVLHPSEFLLLMYQRDRQRLIGTLEQQAVVLGQPLGSLLQNLSRLVTTFARTVADDLCIPFD